LDAAGGASSKRPGGSVRSGQISRNVPGRFHLVNAAKKGTNMQTNQDTTTTPTPAEQAAIDTATKRLKRGREKQDEARMILRHRTEDADLRGERLPADALRSLEDLVTDSDDLVTKLEAEYRAALDAPARRVERDARAAELRSAGEALDAEIADAIERLAVAFEKGDQVAHTISTEFGDPTMGYRVLGAPFKNSTITIRLRFWRQIIRKEKIAEYRRLVSPQVSAPVTITPPKPTTGRILSRAERATRDAAMRATAVLRDGVGVVISETGR
jgi:hypothetical protein